jgi:GxxExxY protein
MVATEDTEGTEKEDVMDDEVLVDEEMEPDPELNRITNLILGAALEVHKELGPGYQEIIYENALELEFRRRGIRYRRQVRFDVRYKGERVGDGRLDFLVEEAVVVELKAVEQLSSLFTAQVIAYLKATGKRLALLLNFNTRRLKDGIRRIAH